MKAYVREKRTRQRRPSTNAYTVQRRRTVSLHTAPLEPSLPSCRETEPAIHVLDMLE